MTLSRPRSLEDVFKTTKEHLKLDACSEITFHDETGINVVYEGKNIYFCGLLGDLERIGKKLNIRSKIDPDMIVRKISFTKDHVVIDVMDGSEPIKFKKTHPVYYEPWMMDSGSYLIYVDQIGDYGKLATEFDIVEIAG